MESIWKMLFKTVFNFFVAQKFTKIWIFQNWYKILAGIWIGGKMPGGNLHWREFAWRDFAWRDFAWRDFELAGNCLAGKWTGGKMNWRENYWRESALAGFFWRESELAGIWIGGKIETHQIVMVDITKITWKLIRRLLSNFSSLFVVE